MRKIPESLRRYGRQDLERFIDEYVILCRNAERNREILKKSWFDGVGFEQLAQEYGLSVTAVKDIVYRSEKKVFSHIK